MTLAARLSTVRALVSSRLGKCCSASRSPKCDSAAVGLLGVGWLVLESCHLAELLGEQTRRFVGVIVTVGLCRLWFR